MPRGKATNQSHHHTDESWQHGKTNKKEPVQISAGRAVNAETSRILFAIGTEIDKFYDVFYSSGLLW